MSLAAEVKRLERQVAELVESRSSGRTPADLRDYHDRPIEFMREVLHFGPWSKQEDIARAILTSKRTVVRGFHGAGKDAVLGALMLWAAYARGMLVLVLSATERQVLGQTWKELSNRWRGGDLTGQLLTSELRIAGEARIIAMPTGSVSNLTGWHDPNGVLVAISEGQGEQVEANAFDAAIANAVDDASRVLVMGNPVKPAGRFYEVSRKSTWKAIRISAFDHPNIVEGRVVIAGGPSPTWPEEMAAEYGVGSPWYVGRVLAEFPETSIDALIQRAWLDAAAERWRERMLPIERMREKVTLALDVAGPGVDQNMLGIVQGKLLRGFESWREADLMKTARHVRVRQQALGMVRMWEPEPLVVVDVNGLGLGAYDRIRELKGRAMDFNGSFRTKGDWRINTDRFLNLRAAAYWNLRELLSKGEAALPDDPELFEELLATEWTTTPGGGLIQIADKRDIRSAIGRSPDKSDCASMGLMPGSGREVSVGHFTIAHGYVAIGD